MRCLPAHYFTVAKARSWRTAIDDAPPYQRGGDAWTLAQRQRFIDSLLNGYDVPKIYLHDLRGEHPTKVYAIVDGKQRLTAIWSYLADGFPLADDFRVEVPSSAGAVAVELPAGPKRFSELHPLWQRRLLDTYLSVVLIRDASEADIDELFARLNDGVPLTAAERRNAFTGELGASVRRLAARPDLRELLAFPDTRGSHREVAAGVLALAAADAGLWALPETLDDRALDDLVGSHGRLDPSTRAALEAAVERRLVSIRRAFGPDDPRLATAPLAVAAFHAAFVAEAHERAAPGARPITPGQPTDRSAPDSSPSG